MRYYALLMWKTYLKGPTYNLFSSALNLWPSQKVVKLFLDPVSMFDKKIVKSHTNFASNTISLAQDFLYGLHCHGDVFFGVRS